MGKAQFYITLLIFIDLLFIITGQACSIDTCNLGSIIFNTLLNLVNFDGSLWLTELIGDITQLFSSKTGFLALATATAVTVATLVTRSDKFLFIPIALSLALISADFIIIYSILAQSSFILATLIMGPIVILYAFTILEWLRVKD